MAQIIIFNAIIITFYAYIVLSFGEFDTRLCGFVK